MKPPITLYHPEPDEPGTSLPDPSEQTVDLPIEDELAAAEIARAHAPQSDLPVQLKARLLTLAESFIAEQTAQPGNDAVTQKPAADPIPFPALESRPNTQSTALLPWAAIAAGLLITVTLTWFIASSKPPVVVQGPIEYIETADPAMTYERYQVEASDSTTFPIAATEPGYESVKGEILWSNVLQTGFMKLTGVPINTPEDKQYQLWIVDPDRDKEPVDGGVFNVSTDGEVIIPIDSKLAVNNPQLFAITLEQPGGVVVSEGPLIIIAKK